MIDKDKEYETMLKRSLLRELHDLTSSIDEIAAELVDLNFTMNSILNHIMEEKDEQANINND